MKEKNHTMKPDEMINMPEENKMMNQKGKKEGSMSYLKDVALLL